MIDIKPISNYELKDISLRGNGFSKVEDAESVAKNRKGSELVVKKDNLFYLYDVKNLSNINTLKDNKTFNIISFVDNNKTYNIKNSEGLQGIGEKVSNSKLVNFAQAGNNFTKFCDAESVAKHLGFDTAIVCKNNKFYLYNIAGESAQKVLAGDSTLIDGKVSGVVKNGKTLYNPQFASPAKDHKKNIAYTENGKIMINEKEFKISGLNVYDLADISDQGELEKTLKVISDSGANTVRFSAFGKNPPEKFLNILETSKKMGLDLKFIPVFGNHWKDCEAPSEAKLKDDKWYANDYKTNYLPHVEETVKKIMHCDNVLMLELMNEPDANHNTLKNFADDASTKIRQLYTDYDKEHNTKTPRHIISLGTDAMVYSIGSNVNFEYAKGLKGEDYKDIYGLPNIDVVTAHDYTYDRGLVGSKYDISSAFKQHIEHSKELNKPFFLGEIGMKVTNRTSGEAMNIMEQKLEMYKNQNISGALLWGPEPRGHAVDGDGFGFKFYENDLNEQAVKDALNVFSNKIK